MTVFNCSIVIIALYGICSSASAVHPITKSKFKVVCYAQIFEHRHNPEPLKMATDLCTHIVYFFASLNEETLTIEFDQGVGFSKDYGQQVAAYKERGIKVTVFLGEWEDDMASKFVRLVQNDTARHLFIQHVVGFLADHNLDGLELPYNYPMCWGDQLCVHRSGQHFFKFLDELSAAFRPNGLLLSVFATGTKLMDASYDMGHVSAVADWIVVALESRHFLTDRTGWATFFHFCATISFGSIVYCF